MKPGALRCYGQFPLRGSIVLRQGKKFLSYKNLVLFSPFYFPLLFNFTVTFSYLLYLILNFIKNGRNYSCFRRALN